MIVGFRGTLKKSSMDKGLGFYLTCSNIVDGGWKEDTETTYRKLTQNTD